MVVDTRVILDRVQDEDFFEEHQSIDYGERGTAMPENLYVIDGTVYEYKDPTTRDIIRAFDVDPQLQATELAMTQPLRSANWSIVPRDGDSGEAYFCREILENAPEEGGLKTPMSTIIAQCARAPFVRRAHFELVWGKGDSGEDEAGQDRLIDIAYRPPETCRMIADDNGRVLGFRQQGLRPNSGGILDEVFGPNKSFVYIYGAHRNPITGHSLAQTGYKTYLDKQKVMRLYFLHLQNVALSSIKGEYDGPEGQAGQEKLTRKLQKLRGGGTVVLGPGESANFFEGGRAGEEFRNALRYLDSQIAGSMLMRFLQLGTDTTTGSWSLSRDHSDFYLMSLESIQHEIASAITSQILSRLVFWNFGPRAKFPAFVFERLSETQRMRALETWEKLVTATTPVNVDQRIMQAISQKAMPALDIELQETTSDDPEADMEAGDPASGTNTPPNSPPPDGTTNGTLDGGGNLPDRTERIGMIVEAINNRGNRSR